MKRVYEIRDEQIKFKEAERQAEIEESQEERNRILHDVTSFKQSEVHRQNGSYNTFLQHFMVPRSILKFFRWGLCP